MIPIPVRVSGRTYAAIFVFFLITWPLFLYVNDKRHAPDPTVAVCVLIALMIASYILNYVRCSSPTLSYWVGLCVVGGFWRSGCVNLNVVVIVPVLFAIHFWILLASLASFFTGKPSAEAAFLRICRRLAPGAFEPKATDDNSEWFRSRH